MTRRDLPEELQRKLAEVDPEIASVVQRCFPTPERERELQRSRAIRQNLDAAERRKRRLQLCQEALQGKHGRQLRDFAAAVERQHNGLPDPAVEAIMRALNEARKGRER